MVSINKHVKAYILLESLIALGVLVTIASLVLGQLGRHQGEIAEQIREQEVLNLALMAVQTGQSSLSLDGLSVQVVQTDQELIVYEGERVVMSLAKN